jgi:predicted transcriptional regulator of viral defense system
MKYIKDIKNTFNDKQFPVFKAYELKTIKGLSDNYRRLLLHNLLSRKEIIRITKGVYTFHKDVDVVAFAFSPSYYGLEDALSIRKLSDQGTNPIVITSRNVRRGLREFVDRNYLVYHIDKRLFFGYEMLKHGDFWIPVSDLEKTLIDMFYFKYSVRKDIWSNILPLLDIKRLKEYLKHYDQRFSKKVLNELHDAKSLNLLENGIKTRK